MTQFQFSGSQQFIQYVHLPQFTQAPMYMMSVAHQQSMTTATTPVTEAPSTSPVPTPPKMGLYVTKKKTTGEDSREISTPEPAQSEADRSAPPQTYVHNPYALPLPAPAAEEEEGSEAGSEDSTSQAPPSNAANDSEAGKKKRKRKKKVVEDNRACDALRFKTRMCKNWEITGKCPYGPRCLFAHGKKELRSYTENNQTILTASRTRSPCRNFFSLGRFPSFIPIPHELLQLGRDGLQFPNPDVSDVTSIPSTPDTPSSVAVSDISRVPSDVPAMKMDTMTA